MTIKGGGRALLTVTVKRVRSEEPRADQENGDKDIRLVRLCALILASAVRLTFETDFST